MSESFKTGKCHSLKMILTFYVWHFQILMFSIFEGFWHFTSFETFWHFQILTFSGFWRILTFSDSDNSGYDTKLILTCSCFSFLPRSDWTRHPTCWNFPCRVWLRRSGPFRPRRRTRPASAEPRGVDQRTVASSPGGEKTKRKYYCFFFNPADPRGIT